MKKLISFLFVSFAAAAMMVSCKPTGEEPNDPSNPGSGEISISLDKTSLNLLEDESAQLVATVSPEGTTVTWSSDNLDVAVVGNTGMVKAVGQGSCIITAKAGGKSAQCAVNVTRGEVVVDDALKGSNYYLLFLDEESASQIPAEKIVKDYRVNEADIMLYIWPTGDSYAKGTAVGKNSFGLAQEWLCLQAQADPWGGTGAGASNMTVAGLDFSGTDDTYTFRCAYKSTDGGKNEIGFMQAGNSEPVWIELPAQTDGQWHVFEKTLGELGLSWSAPFDVAQNILTFRSSPANTTLNLDAAFIYKK